MERVLRILLAAGYPREAAAWLRRRRRSIVIGLALLSWLLFIGVGWLAWRLLSFI